MPMNTRRLGIGNPQREESPTRCYPQPKMRNCWHQRPPTSVLSGQNHHYETLVALLRDLCCPMSPFGACTACDLLPGVRAAVPGARPGSWLFETHSCDSLKRGQHLSRLTLSHTPISCGSMHVRTLNGIIPQILARMMKYKQQPNSSNLS